MHDTKCSGSGMTLSTAPFNSSCICDVEYLEDDHEEARLAVQMPFSSLSIFVFCVLIRGGAAADERYPTSGHCTMIY